MSRENKDKGQESGSCKISDVWQDFSDVKRHILNADKEVLLAGKAVLEVFIGWIDKANEPKKKVEKIKID
jgi:hypothetical protein